MLFDRAYTVSVADWLAGVSSKPRRDLTRQWRRATEAGMRFRLVAGEGRRGERRDEEDREDSPDHGGPPRAPEE